MEGLETLLVYTKNLILCPEVRQKYSSFCSLCMLLDLHFSPFNRTLFALSLVHPRFTMSSPSFALALALSSQLFNIGKEISQSEEVKRALPAAAWPPRG
jgi:hypothetical protein